MTCGRKDYSVIYCFFVLVNCCVLCSVDLTTYIQQARSSWSGRRLIHVHRPPRLVVGKDLGQCSKEVSDVFLDIYIDNYVYYYIVYAIIILYIHITYITYMFVS